MTRYSYQIVFPEGDAQEIEHQLRINQLVDLNGYPLGPSLPTTRMIVFRVWRQSTDVLRGEETVSYFLELLRVDELEEMAPG